MTHDAINTLCEPSNGQNMSNILLSIETRIVKINSRLKELGKAILPQMKSIKSTVECKLVMQRLHNDVLKPLGLLESLLEKQTHPPCFNFNELVTNLRLFLLDREDVVKLVDCQNDRNMETFLNNILFRVYAVGEICILRNNEYRNGLVNSDGLVNMNEFSTKMAIYFNITESILNQARCQHEQENAEKICDLKPIHLPIISYPFLNEFYKLGSLIHQTNVNFDEMRNLVLTSTENIKQIVTETRCTSNEQIFYLTVTTEFNFILRKKKSTKKPAEWCPLLDKVESNFQSFVTDKVRMSQVLVSCANSTSSTHWHTLIRSIYKSISAMNLECFKELNKNSQFYVGDYLANQILLSQFEKFLDSRLLLCNNTQSIQSLECMELRDTIDEVEAAHVHLIADSSQRKHGCIVNDSELLEARNDLGFKLFGAQNILIKDTDSVDECWCECSQLRNNGSECAAIQYEVIKKKCTLMLGNRLSSRFVEKSSKYVIYMQAREANKYFAIRNPPHLVTRYERNHDIC